MADNIIELHNLSFRYGKTTALNDISLSIPPGVFGVLGPNGAGKTTLMKVLLGFLKPSSGQGRVLDGSLSGDLRLIRQSIGYMPENDSLIPQTDAINLTAYMGTLVGMPWHEAVKRAHEVLFYVGLDDSRYRMVHTYSTGMKQRLKLAAALVHDPKLLLLDEPTSGMDPHARQEMLALIQDIARKGDMNILFSSHILADIEATCQRVIIMNRGQLVAEKELGGQETVLDSRYRIKLQGDLSRLPQSIGSHLLPLEHPGYYHLSLDQTLDKKQFLKTLLQLDIQLREYIPEKESLATAFETIIGENHEH